MEGLLETEVLGLRARLEASDPILKDCVLVVVMVRTDGTMETIANVSHEDLNIVLEHAKVTKRGKTVRVN